MKVLLLNGSPKQGNTYRALQEVANTLHEENIETQIIGIDYEPQPDCIGCGACHGCEACVMGGNCYERVREALATADGLIVGSPVYYAGPSGAICSLLDRVFMSCKQMLEYKPAAAIVVCRRGGASAAFDRLNKYFQIYNMPVVSSQYWNMVYGHTPGEADLDGEGLQTMRTLAHNMAWALRHLTSTAHPTLEDKIKTNFIR
ncbi:MAG: flavodoxin family protein [Paludibacteraceae bacterium]|nr:flavodoxin family protein [Paludibacteraceae bacterium]